MRGRIRVWHASNGFGYAGTERAMEAWCRGLDPGRFEVSAYSRLEGGPRLQGLRQALKNAAVLGPNPLAWRRRLKSQGCDVLHLHRHGEADFGWDLLIKEARDAGVRVIVETNIFGARDGSGLGATLDHHFFVSAMCLWRYAGWPAALPADFGQRHSVLYNPLRKQDFPAQGPSLAARKAARKKLGLPLDAFICGRLGRPDLNKWPAWLPKAFAQFARKNPAAHLALMQAPESVKREFEALGISRRISYFAASSDWKRVRLFYEALDCLAHGSRVGESFGYTLAEAAAFGIPALVDSTPWADNAQVEVVEHGVTGLVAGRPLAFSRGLELLCRDPKLCARLGSEGRKRAWKRFDAAHLAAQLGGTYAALLAGSRVPAQAWHAGFGAEYPRRLRLRVDPAPLRDGLWGLGSAIKLYWRGWASRFLKRLGLKK